MVIAIVKCKKSADKNCMGDCLATYAAGAHPGEFPGYYFHCGGCESVPGENASFLEKIEKLKEKGVRKVHFSSCVKESCPNISTLETVFADNGFETEFACRNGIV